MAGVVCTYHVIGGGGTDTTMDEIWNNHVVGGRATDTGGWGFDLPFG